MALRVNEVTLTKGEYITTIYSVLVSEIFSNKLTPLTIPVGRQNQDSGSRKPKVIDLLRITRKFTIKGHIINNTDKNALIQIINGAGQKGGPVILSYPDGADNTTFNTFIESFTIEQKSTDEPDSPPTDYAKYDVDITLIEGETVG